MQKRITRHPLLIFITLLSIPVLGTVLSGMFMFDLPQGEISQLVSMMALTGSLTALLFYALYRLRILEWFSSLRWAIFSIIALMEAVTFVYVLVIARFTFIESHYLALTLVLLVFAGLSALTIGFLAAKTMTDRLSKFSDATTQLASGDFSIRLDITGSDEIAQLAQTFNGMALSLEELNERKSHLEKTRRDLTAWMSHDLRTPLTSMRVMIEAMLDGVVQDRETVNRYLDSSRAEIEHLTRLIDDLFELAQLDEARLRLKVERASIRDMISDTLGGMRLEAEQKGITLRGEVTDDTDMIDMAPDKIQRVLTNLVNNAIKYTDSGESITLSAGRSGDSIRIEVHNSGAYIPQAMLPRIFENFYRCEGARTRDADGARGAGLGLAIARGFVEAHGGVIQATSDKDKGTTFSFTLPQAAQRDTIPARNRSA